MIALSVLVTTVGVLSIVFIVTLCITYFFADKNMNESSAWVKASIIVIVIGVLILSIGQVTFLNHPEDYGYTKIEEVEDESI